MKRVRITFEAIVEDEQIKSIEDIQNEGFDDLEDAITTDGLEGVIEGSYTYSTKWEIENEEIKRCPFCGGEAELKENELWYWVQCKNCHTTSRGSSYESKVTECWNRRDGV